jgi:anaerobic dimethyl sulfoxide reductase subunit B (iron-sulfur subunit)
MAQYGFFFDQSRCTGCQTCTVACKDWNDVPPGPAKWLRMFRWEKGTFPNLETHQLFAPCYHCENPVCVDACPNGALYKEDKYGAVLVDHEKCEGTRVCWQACPYGAIVFESDKPGEKAQKCTMCIDKLEQDEKPVCVMSCTMRALDFGPFNEIQTNYGELKQLEDMPSHETTWPAIVFRPRDTKRQLVPYDAEKAKELLQYRWPMPPVFQSLSDLEATELVAKNKLVMKPRDEEELMFYTREDDA